MKAILKPVLSHESACFTCKNLQNEIWNYFGPSWELGTINVVLQNLEVS